MDRNALKAADSEDAAMEEDSLDEIRLGLLVDEVFSIVGKEVNQDEVMQALIVNKYDIRATANSLANKSAMTRQSPDRRHLGCEVESIPVQYQLPKPFCCDSAMIFEEKELERLPLNKLIRDWLIDILRKRSREKRKEEKSQYFHRRNESQCSEESLVTTSDSQDILEDTSQDLSEDSQEVVIDYFDMETSKNSEKRDSTIIVESHINSQSNILPSPSQRILPTSHDNHISDSPVVALNKSGVRGDACLYAYTDEESIVSESHQGPNYPVTFDNAVECSLVSAITSPETQTVNKNNESKPYLSASQNISTENQVLSFSTLSPSSPGGNKACLSTFSDVSSSLSNNSTKTSLDLSPNASFSLGTKSNMTSLVHCSIGSGASSNAPIPVPSFSQINLPSLTRGSLEGSSGSNMSFTADSCVEPGGLPIPPLSRSSEGIGGQSLASLGSGSLGPNPNVPLSNVGAGGFSFPLLSRSSGGMGGSSLSSLASGCLGSPNPNLPLSSVGAGGFSILPFSRSLSGGTAGPSVASFASGSLGPPNPNLPLSSEGTGEFSIPPLSRSSEGTGGPSLASLASGSLGPPNPNLPLSSVGAGGFSIPPLSRCSTGESAGPSLASLASGYLCPPNPNLPLSSTGNNSPYIPISLNSAITNSERNILSSRDLPAPPLASIKISGSESNVETSRPSLSTLATSFLTSQPNVYSVPPLDTKRSNENMIDSHFDISLLKDSRSASSSLPSSGSGTICDSYMSKAAVGPSQTTYPENKCAAESTADSSDSSCLSLLASLSVTRENTTSVVPPLSHSKPSLRPPPGFEQAVPKGSRQERQSLDNVLRQEEADICDDIDLQGALIKSQIAQEIPVNMETTPADIFIDVQMSPFVYDPTLFKSGPSSFGKVIMKAPRVFRIKRLTEKSVRMPFRIFKFDTLSPDEMIEKALQNHRTPEWYRLVAKERHNKR
ncbi:hypothetical protein SK128_027708 [Halocaridina rubra]|uniref:Uncharacterized protein n=1 Tax=Halocaridina rubra TaxID=373956 RepID=A0AAN8XBN3_HALRR